ncbi:MAG: hypothetical protein MSA56_06195 [Clostridium sp.]|nr:hypothetical protein [Clostridium sp.]
MEQQTKLMLGIWELKETYIELKKLDFSNDILQDIENSVDDLMGLVEKGEIRDFLLSNDIVYNADLDRYSIQERATRY